MAAKGTSKVTTGNNIMMLGLVVQVITLAIFGLMAIDVYFRIRRYQGQFTQSAEKMRRSRRFRGLIAAITISYTAILIRCIYRIAEMAGGWRNPIMQNQTAFIVLDGAMCTVAVLALNIFHPGFLFRQSYATIKAEGMGVTDMAMGSRWSFVRSWVTEKLRNGATKLSYTRCYSAQGKVSRWVWGRICLLDEHSWVWIERVADGSRSWTRKTSKLSFGMYNV